MELINWVIKLVYFTYLRDVSNLLKGVIIHLLSTMNIPVPYTKNLEKDRPFFFQLMEPSGKKQKDGDLRWSNWLHWASRTRSGAQIELPQLLGTHFFFHGNLRVPPTQCPPSSSGIEIAGPYSPSSSLKNPEVNKALFLGGVVLGGVQVLFRFTWFLQLLPWRIHGNGSWKIL